MYSLVEDDTEVTLKTQSVLVGKIITYHVTV